MAVVYINMFSSALTPFSEKTMAAAVHNAERFGSDCLTLFAPEAPGLDLYKRQVVRA